MVGQACQTQNGQQVYLEQYIGDSFDSILVYSYFSESYDMDSIESFALQAIDPSTTMDSVYDILQRCIQSIDHHGYVLYQEEFIKLHKGHPDFVPNPYPFQGKMLRGQYAHIAVDGFLGGDSTLSDNYTDSLQRVVLDLYNKGPKGWIIDLRNNGGGWVYSMLAGLGPILGKGIKSYEIDRAGNTTEFYYIKDEEKYLLISDNAYILERQLPTVVLIGPNTGSAAEQLTLAFIGNPKTVTMGEPTYGVPTGNYGFFMPDSAQICVANSIMTDRTKTIGDGQKIESEILETHPIALFEKAYGWIDSLAIH